MISRRIELIFQNLLSIRSEISRRSDCVLEILTVFSPISGKSLIREIYNESTQFTYLNHPFRVERELGHFLQMFIFLVL